MSEQILKYTGPYDSDQRHLNEGYCRCMSLTLSDPTKSKEPPPPKKTPNPKTARVRVNVSDLAEVSGPVAVLVEHGEKQHELLLRHPEAMQLRGDAVPVRRLDMR